MVFGEPKVEFIELDLTDVIVASPPKCQDDGKTGTGSGEDCVGPDAIMNNCSKYNTMMMN